MRFFSRVSVWKLRLGWATDKQVYFFQKTKRMTQLNKGYRQAIQVYYTADKAVTPQDIRNHTCRKNDALHTLCAAQAPCC